MCREQRLAVIFIADDLSVVKHSSDRVMVMSRGRVMEDAPKRPLFAAPLLAGFSVSGANTEPGC